MSRSPAKNTTSGVLLAAILTLGLITACAFVFIGISIVGMMFQTRDYRQLVFTIEGQPLIEYHEPSTQIYRTLDGQKIEDRKSLEFAPNLYSSLPAKAKREWDLPGWEWRVTGFNANSLPLSFWYLVRERAQDRDSYFVGYDPITRRSIGYLGTKGFREDVPPASECFHAPFGMTHRGGFTPRGGTMGNEPSAAIDEGETTVYMLADDTLWAVDFAHQTVKRLELPGKPVSVGKYDELASVEDERKFTSKTRIAVRLPEQVEVYDLQFKPLRTVPVPAEVREDELQLIGTIGDQVILQASPQDRAAPTQLYWVGVKGDVVRHESVPPLYPPSDDKRSSAWAICAMVPIPAFLAAVSFADPGGPNSQPEDYWPDYFEFLRDFLPPFLLVCLISLALAVYCYRRQRAYAAGGATAWAVFVFLTGLPGLIGYLLHRSWPVREKCPHCGATVPRDRSACARCHQGFAPPALKGIEVFA